MKVAYFDIEAWDLAPEFAPVLCAVVLSHAGVGEEEVVVLRQDEYVKRKKADGMSDDVALLEDLRDVLDRHHIVVAWNGLGYDLPLIRTRLVKAGKAPQRNTLVIDPMYAFRGWHGIKPKTSKLADVAAFFGVGDKPQVSPQVWLKAREGDKAAMDEVVDRCKADTRLLRDVTELAFDFGLINRINKAQK